LPSSPHEIRSQASASDDFIANQMMVTTWNKVLRGSPFIKKPLLLSEEWNIDFSELTIGTRVGIGEPPKPTRTFCSFHDMLIKLANDFSGRLYVYFSYLCFPFGSYCVMR
jgi:hypothetical protein